MDDWFALRWTDSRWIPFLHSLCTQQMPMTLFSTRWVVGCVDTDNVLEIVVFELALAYTSVPITHQRFLLSTVHLTHPLKCFLAVCSYNEIITEQ